MNADERRCNSTENASINALTERSIGCAFTVSNTLGAGFLEKVYENALAHELQKAGFHVVQQVTAPVIYDGIVVGDYIIDLLVENEVDIELKAAKTIDPTHVAQTINYLRATRHQVGLILNFGNPRLEIKRLVHQL